MYKIVGKRDVSYSYNGTDDIQRWVVDVVVPATKSKEELVSISKRVVERVIKDIKASYTMFFWAEAQRKMGVIGKVPAMASVIYAPMGDWSMAHRKEENYSYQIDFSRFEEE